MPGRNETLSQAFDEIRSLSIDRIICLAPLDDIRGKVRSYADAIESGNLPCACTLYPIEDFGVPTDLEAFTVFTIDMAKLLNDSKRLLMHCGAGIGRTGTVACCVLLALGVAEDDARALIRKAGSRPETDAQSALIHWFAQTKSCWMLS
jgi:protein-tyrosine phosphatase